MRRKGLFFIALLVFCFTLQGRAQQVTISNNLLYDAWLTPNLRVGLRFSPHWSMGLTGGYRPWPADEQTSRKWKHLLVSPDLRYWTDSVNVHHFFGVNLIYSHYNVADVKFPLGFWKSVRHERRQGDFGAVGLFYGYSWPLGRFWNLEAHIGAALGYTKFSRYACGHCGKKIGTDKKLFVLPQAGLSVVYNIPGRPRPQAVVPQEAPLPVEVPTAKVEEKPFVPAVHPVPDFTGRAGQLQQDNPVLAHVSQYRPYDRTRILRKEKGALYVYFGKGKTSLDSTFRENRAVLDRIIDITRQVMADSTSSVKKIQLVGLASVDGAVSANERVAQGRANALQKYIQRQLSVPDTLFDTVGGGEAWAEFRDQLNDALLAGNGSVKEAINIIDNESNPDVRERKLRQLDKGRFWQYATQNILKDQRNSGYIRIYYDYAPDKAAAVINEASELLQTDCGDCHREALRLLQGVRNDKRAQNALGSALWLCGQQQEALDCFRRAAADGNADARENLRQLDHQVR